VKVQYWRAGTDWFPLRVLFLKWIRKLGFVIVFLSSVFLGIVHQWESVFLGLRLFAFA